MTVNVTGGAAETVGDVTVNLTGGADETWQNTHTYIHAEFLLHNLRQSDHVRHLTLVVF